jgi:Lon protease-like protein
MKRASRPDEPELSPDRAKLAPAEILPAVGLYQRVLLPGSRACVALTTVSAYGAAREATRAGDLPLLAVFSAHEAGTTADALSPVGVLATVTDLRHTGGLWVADLRGVYRARKDEVLRSQPFRVARVERSPEPTEDPATLLPLAAAVHRAVACLRYGHRCVLALVQEQLRAAAPWEIPGLVMPVLDQVPWTAWQALLETDSVEGRLAFVLAHLRAQQAEPAA